MASWFLQWKFQVAPPIQVFPDTTFVLEYEGKLICSCAVYMSKTGGFAHAIWFVMNPSIKKEIRKDCISKLLVYISDYCKNNGYYFLFSNVSRGSLHNTLVKNGFAVTDQGVTNLIKTLI